MQVACICKGSNHEMKGFGACRLQRFPNKHWLQQLLKSGKDMTLRRTTVEIWDPRCSKVCSKVISCHCSLYFSLLLSMHTWKCPTAFSFICLWIKSAVFTIFLFCWISYCTLYSTRTYALYIFIRVHPKLGKRLSWTIRSGKGCPLSTLMPIQIWLR